MTFRGFVSRDEIGLVKPKSVSYNIAPEKGGSLGHHAGPAVGIDTHSDCLSAWRNWQKYHMYTHGWVDIAYTCGVCDHGYVLAGRGAGVRTAANGSNDANYRFYAIQWIGGGNERPTADAADAFWWAVKHLQTQGGAGSHVGKHSDVRSTACPGNLGAVIDAGPTNQGDTGMARKEPADWAKASWDKAMAAKIFSSSTNADDVVTAEKLAVFLDRAGVLDPDSPVGEHSHTLPAGKVTWPTNTRSA